MGGGPFLGPGDLEDAAEGRDLLAGDAAVGLGDWVAADDDGYAAIACRYATQPALLAKLRADLPAQIAASPAGNVELYSREVEAAYRQFWRDYCASASKGGEGA